MGLIPARWRASAARQRRARLWSADFLGTELIPVHVRQACSDFEGLVLDVGCGTQPYRELLPAQVTYIAYDVDASRSRPHVIGVAGELPFDSSCFDAIISTQVIEHVPDPAKMISEMSRVLRPGGKLVITAPQYWRLHEKPHDFFRFTRYGLQELIRRAGLQPNEVTAQGGVWRLVGQAVNSALWSRFGSNVPTHGIFLAINLVALCMERLWLDSDDTLNYVAKASKPRGDSAQEGAVGRT